MRFTTFASVIAATAIATSSAQSADLGGYDGSLKDSPMVYEQPFSWSGFYFGGHIGGAWGSVDGKYDCVERESYEQCSSYDQSCCEASDQRFSLDPDGWSGGFQAGVQRQYGHLVAGFELTYSFQDLDDMSLASGPGDNVFIGTEIGNLFTAGFRLGYARERLLGYLKAGYARAEIGLAAYEDDGGSPGDKIVSAKDHEGGYFLGGGFEYAVRDRVSVGVDYTYANFDVGNSKFTDEECEYFFRDIDADLHQVTFRVNFLLHHGDTHHEPMK